MAQSKIPSATTSLWKKTMTCPPPLVPDGDKHQLVEEDNDVPPPLMPDGDNHPDPLSKFVIAGLLFILR
jgi:hypothetical protein